MAVDRYKKALRRAGAGKSLARRYPRQAGLIGGIPELVIALGVGGFMMASLVTLGQEQVESIQAQVAAQQIRMVREASAVFMREHFDALKVTSVNPQDFTVDELASTDTFTRGSGAGQRTFRGGYLPEGTQAFNPYNQEYRLRVRVIDPDGAVPNGDGDEQLEGLVYTTISAEGRAIPVDQATQIALLSGAEGGYVPYGPDVDPGACGRNGAPGTCARGAYNGWVADLEAFGINPPSGTLASIIQLNQAGVIGDALMRHEVPGTDANRMFTNLEMGTPSRVDGRPRFSINDAERVIARNVLTGEVLSQANQTIARVMNLDDNQEVGGVVSAGILATNQLHPAVDVDNDGQVDAGQAAIYRISLRGMAPNGDDINILRTRDDDAVAGATVELENFGIDYASARFNVQDKAGNLVSAPLGQFMSKIWQSSALVGNGARVPKPQCLRGFRSAIFVTPARVEMPAHRLDVQTNLFNINVAFYQRTWPSGGSFTAGIPLAEFHRLAPYQGFDTWAQEAGNDFIVYIQALGAPNNPDNWDVVTPNNTRAWGLAETYCLWCGQDEATWAPQCTVH